MRRTGWVLCLVLLLLCLPVARAGAHGGAMTAMVSLAPPDPRPGGTAVLTAALTDVYQATVPGGQVQVTIRLDGQQPPPPAELKEGPAGTYSGQVTLPGAGTAIIRIEATLPDGVWMGQLPVSIGPGEVPLSEMGLDLVHQDTTPPAATPALTPPGHRLWWLIGGGAGLAAAMAAARRLKAPR